MMMFASMFRAPRARFARERRRSRAQLRAARGAAPALRALPRFARAASALRRRHVYAATTAFCYSAQRRLLGRLPPAHAAGYFSLQWHDPCSLTYRVMNIGDRERHGRATPCPYTLNGHGISSTERMPPGWA